jgi:hypothetical protein
MKWNRNILSLLACSVAALLATDAQAGRYSTVDPGGADVELREENPTSNRGTNSEIASRIEGGSRNSLIYLKFGVGSISAGELAGDITVRTTFRNTNLSSGRITDVAGGGPNTGMDYFVLDPTLTGANWDELTITPVTAPGYAFDGNFMTKATGTPGSPTAGLTYLGKQRFRDLVPPENNLPVGENFDFVAAAGSPLHSAILAAQGTAHQTVTVVMGAQHEWDNPNGNWLNFNYLFNPKDQTTLNDGRDNSQGQFAPALITIPEPGSVALLSLAGVALVRRRR